MKEERRKIRRRILMFFTRVYDSTRHEMLGHLGDLTIAGAMVISQMPLEINRDYDLEIELPEGKFDKAMMSLKAQAIWTSPDIDPEFYNTGFELLNVSPENLDLIEQILSRYAIR